MKGFKDISNYKWLYGFICYVLSFFVVASPTGIVGSMKGSASVSSGSASYSLPFDLPKGIHGLTPSFGVQYKQGSGNGVLGLGFHLSGLSSISRCTKTLRTDGVKGAIDFNFDDVYCLDGERLILVSGQNGRGGSEYRVGNKLTTKVVANGTALSSPESWTVYSNDGYIIDYGTSQNSVESANNHNLIWHVSAQKDRFNNELTYFYELNNGNHNLSSAQYNDVVVSFIYSSRPDQLISYRFGEVRKLTQLLSQVAINNSGGSLRKINFTYDQVILKGDVEYSRLKQVEVCDAENLCMPPHKFQWETNINSRVEPQNIDIFKLDTLKGYVTGDLNNDGLTDICYFTDGLYCSINEGDAVFSDAVKWTTAFDGSDWDKVESHSSLSLIDINNDTFIDVCAFNEQGFFCAKNDKNGRFVDAHYWSSEFTIKDAARLIDLDKDQLIDVCKIESDKVTCIYNNGTGFEPPFILSNTGWPLEKEAWVRKLNPNYSSNSTSQGSRNSGSNTNNTNSVPKYIVEIDSWGKLPQPRFLDINQDGHIDICGFKLDGFFYCSIGFQDLQNSRTKLSWHSPSIWARNFPLGVIIPFDLHDRPSKDKIFNEDELENDEVVLEHLLRTFKLQDVNNDGLADICYRDGNSYQCQLNSGREFLAAEEWYSLSDNNWTITDTVGAIESSIQLSDRNGDGLGDFCYINADKLSCAYNNGKEFVGPDEVVILRVDLEDIEKQSKFYSNPVRKWFGLETKVQALYTRSAYGPFKQVSDLNGDATFDDCYRSFTGLSCLLYEHEPLALLSGVTSGLGYQTHFDYGFTSNPDIFTPGQENILPLYSVHPNLKVVTALRSDNGIGGENVTKYEYEGYLAHQKFGLLGFSKIIQIDIVNSRKTVQSYDLDSEFRPYLISSKVQIGDRTIGTQHFEYIEKGSEFSSQMTRQLVSKQAKGYDLDGTLLNTETTRYRGYDKFQYPGIVEKTVQDSLGNIFIERTETLFRHDESNWLLGKPERISVTKQSPQDNQTRTTVFTYDSSTGALVKQVIQPEHELALTQTFTYNSLGFRIGEMETGKNVSRHSQTDYDSKGRVIGYTNSLGHRTATIYDTLCDLPSSVTDANGLTTLIEYDSFCRKSKEVAPDGSSIEWIYQWSDGADAGLDRDGLVLGDRSVYQLTEQSSLGAWSTVYYDVLGREVRRKQLGFENKVVIVDRAYDEQGRVAGQTIPYYEGLFPGDATYWSLTKFDLLGRVIRTLQPTEEHDYIETTFSYNGTTVLAQGQDGNLRAETKDGLGRVVEVIENSKSTIHYQYDAYGNLAETNANGLITKIEYDLMGNKISMSDPAMGRWSYGYDAKGRILWQRDAKGQQSDYTYDVLGRKLTETAPGVSNRWQYDSIFLGALTSEKSLVSDKHYTYDKLGRVLSMTVTINEQAYSTSYEYDEDGRLSRVNYPSGLSLDKDYDINGLLKRASLPNNDIWNKDYLKLEKALKETAASIVELEIQAANYEESALFYLEESERLRINAAALFEQSEGLEAEAAQLQESADSLYQASMKNANLANSYRDKAQYYWDIFGDRVFKYDKTENNVAYYKYDECIKSNHKGCKKREYFQAAVPAWMVEHSFCFSWKMSAEVCYTGPDKSINLSNVYKKWATHYQTIADEQLDQSHLNSEQSSEYQAQAHQASQKANELLVQAQNYADLARVQTDLLSASMNELDSLVATQEELTTELDQRLSDDTSIIVWMATNRDSFGQVTGELFGNGFVTRRVMDKARGTVKRIITELGDTAFRDISYEYDIRNNVRRKTSHIRLQEETYEYDEFDRLTYWLFDDTSDIQKQVREYEYDVYGNLTGKTGVGRLEVDKTGRVISDKTGLYAYDANGNMLSGRGRSFKWNSFNKVTELNERGQELAFQYGANQERIKRTVGSKTTYYVSPDYEVDVEQNEQGQRITTMRHRIFADGQVVAEHVKTKIDGEKQIDKTAYFHRDALNTADLITDNMSLVQLERTYTPFGEVYNVVETQSLPTFIHENLRGYTGHENVGVGTLINMNARFYDPVIGRFISADSMIPSPSNSQSYNRYAYVYNNPLKYTDPSGHFAWIPFVIGAAIFTASMTFEDPNIQMVGAVIGTVLMGVAGMPAGGFASAEAAFVSGARVGFTTGLIGSGGDVGAAVKGGVLGGASAAVAWGIGHGFGENWNIAGKALGHGVTQGGFSELRGGSFREGFIGGAVGKIGGSFVHANISESMQPVGMIAVAGIAAKASGADSNDAVMSAAISAVTVYLYNDVGCSKGQMCSKNRTPRKSSPITDEEREFSNAGNRKAFWTSRTANGDPMGPTALAIVNNEGLNGVSANIFASLGGFINGEDVDLEALGVDLMHAHVKAVDGDKHSVPHYLNAEQIQDYHWPVFIKHGIPTGFYGGTLLNIPAGSLLNAPVRALYCPVCDKGF